MGHGREKQEPVAMREDSIEAGTARKSSSFDFAEETAQSNRLLLSSRR